MTTKDESLHADTRHLSDDEFLDAFESCALAANLFHHADHIRLALLHVLRLGDRAPDASARAIRRFAMHYHASREVPRDDHASVDEAGDGGGPEGAARRDVRAICRCESGSISQGGAGVQILDRAPVLHAELHARSLNRYRTTSNLFKPLLPSASLRPSRPARAIIPQASNTAGSALSLDCCGARADLDVLTDEMALYAIPSPSLAAFAERIAVLSKANGILTKFHQIRRADFAVGKTPTMQDSLAALQSAG